jgi:hypothetical protein
MTRRRSIPLLLLACAALVGVARGDATSSTSPYDWAKWRQFWSFKAVVKPAVPAVSD